MRDRMKKLIRMLSAVLVLFWLSSIAYGQTEQPQAEQTEKSPTVQEASSNLRIGVVAARFRPDIRLEKPMSKGKAAWFGTTGGAIYTWGALTYFTGGWGFLAGIYAAPVGAAVGAVAGTIKGTPAKEIAKSDEAIQNHLGAFGFQEVLSNQIATATEQNQNTFASLGPQGPEKFDEKITYDLSSYEDIDAILEVAVKECELTEVDKNQGDFRFNPDFQFNIRANARLFTTKEKKVVDELFVYSSSQNNKFTRWGADNGQLLRQELDRGVQYLARQIVERVRSFRIETQEASSMSDVEAAEHHEDTPLLPTTPDIAAQDLDTKPDDFLQAPQKASLYIYRNQSFGGAVSVSVNGQEVGNIGAKSYILLNLLPGRYTIESHAENDSMLSLSIQAGKNYFVRQEVKMGFWEARCRLEQVDETTGRTDVTEPKLIATTVSKNDLTPQR
jgi:hypothetical protein